MVVEACCSYDVVIPCYNRAHVVADAVQSVLRQTLPATRIVLVDDASADNSWKILAGLAKRHPTVKAIKQPLNSGVSASRNLGASLCRAPWIVFLDSDDLWLPEAAESLLGHASAAEVIVGNFRRVEGALPPQSIESLWHGEDIKSVLQERNVVGPSWSIVRRDSFDRAGGFDIGLRTCEDWALYKKVSEQGGRFVHADHCVAHYRTVPGPRLMDETEQLTRDTLTMRAHSTARLSL